MIWWKSQLFKATQNKVPDKIILQGIIISKTLLRIFGMMVSPQIQVFVKVKVRIKIQVSRGNFTHVYIYEGAFVWESIALGRVSILW